MFYLNIKTSDEIIVMNTKVITTEEVYYRQKA